MRQMAQEYADRLASDCGPTVHESYEKRGGYGENLASNSGFDRGVGSWGELKPVDLVMTPNENKIGCQCSLYTGALEIIYTCWVC